jgi:acyl-[acyl-carrier-protein] desaturase
VYDLRIHLDDVVQPLLRYWGVFQAPGLDGEEGTRALADLESFLAKLAAQADRQRTLLAALAERAGRQGHTAQAAAS